MNATSTDLPPDAVARAHRATDTIHSMIYFAPEAEHELVAVGLRPGRMCYFASRSAAMGKVGPGVVAATFYNFNPELIARHIPRAWGLAEPDDILVARLTAADKALRRMWGAEVVESDEVAEAASLARAATVGLDPAGRPLYAAHAELPWPEPAHLQLWHAASLLREHRGDGHLAALLHHGLSGIESIVTHTATGRGFLESSAKLLRGWSDEQWAATVAELHERGILTADAELTPSGRLLRAELEADTDAMAAAPYLSLGAERTARLTELGRGLSRRIAAAGAFPPGVFATSR